MGKPLSECTIEELRSKAKTFTALLAVICIMMAIVAATVIYLISTGVEISPAMIAAFVAILAGAIPSMSGLAAVKKELAKRNSNP